MTRRVMPSFIVFELKLSSSPTRVWLRHGLEQTRSEGTVNLDGSTDDRTCQVGLQNFSVPLRLCVDHSNLVGHCTDCVTIRSIRDVVRAQCGARRIVTREAPFFETLLRARGRGCRGRAPV